MISIAYAQDAAASSMSNIVPLLLVFAIFYFLIIRPQHKKLKTHQNMVQNLKKGDHVVTAGGIVAKITSISENDALIQAEISDGVVITLNKHTISEVTEQTIKPAASTATKKAAPKKAAPKKKTATKKAAPKKTK